MVKELSKFIEVFGIKAPTYLEEYVIDCIKQYNTMSWQSQREFVNEFYQGDMYHFVSGCSDSHCNWL